MQDETKICFNIPLIELRTVLLYQKAFPVWIFPAEDACSALILEAQPSMHFVKTLMQ